MTDGTSAELDAVDREMSEPGNPRLDAWIARTATPLDLLALFTIWLTVIPLGDFHQVGGKPVVWFVARITVSFIYFIDIAVRTRLAHRKVHYLATHPLSIVAVVLPAVRLVFSLRLLTSMFRKGNLTHFLFVSVVLLFNLTIIVFGFEHRAPGANIVSLGDAVWWACVTVFTVGYGDFYPITTGGMVFAVVIMGLGLLTAAVITAQIASSFMDQAARRRAAANAGTSAGGGANADADAPPAPTSEDAALLTIIRELQQSLGDRLDSIERSLHRGGSDVDQT